jgi:very-short-patch-repair endonuclease
MTREEAIIWEFVRRNNLGFKFLKQKPISRFIMDFYCPQLLLAIEIDGGYHEKRTNYDEGRDLILGQRQIVTLRYLNEDVIKNTDQVKENIRLKVRERSNQLAFSP